MQETQKLQESKLSLCELVGSLMHNEAEPYLASMFRAALSTDREICDCELLKDQELLKNVSVPLLNSE